MNATGHRLNIPRKLTAFRELCATEKTRYALDAVLVERRAGVGSVTVTQGTVARLLNVFVANYLARAEWDAPGEDFRALVPGESFTGGRSRTGPLTLEILGDKAQLGGKPVTLADDTFPSVAEVLPGPGRVDAVTVTLHTLQVLRVSEAFDAHARAVRVLSDPSDDDGAPGALAFEFSLGALVLRGTSNANKLGAPDLKLKPTELEVRQSFTVGLNPRYLHKLANALRDAAGVSGPVTLKFAGANKAILVSAVEGQRDGVRYTGLLMPVYGVS